MATRMDRIDEFKTLAESNLVERRDAAVVYATLANATALVRVGDFLEELLGMVKDSSCGHGTPTLFSPCVDCQKRNNG